ncbi:MAG: glycoside hydrolase family 18 protein, partial [Ktedonobacteraceae bacterium]|nr:glycoside hydrolase family 18 protein [Ktedonobacteraceae bacterium]
LNYAFGNISPNLQCFEVNQAGAGDAWADYQRPASASESVTGVADSTTQALKGNFNQIKALKTLYPNIKAVISIGGWTWSARFSDAALTPQSRATFVKSCIDQYIVGNLPRLDGDTTGGPGAAASVFDGIDIDWEYPATEGNAGNVFRPQDTRNFTLLLAEFRKQLDALGQKTHRHYLLTIAAPAGESKYTKIELNKISRSLDWINLMTYDYHGSWETSGPTNFVAPLYSSPQDPSPAPKQYIDKTVNAYLHAGIPANKLVLGLPFYGYGWTNVPNINHGLYQSDTSTTITSGGGTANYNVLKTLTSFTGYHDPVTRAFWIFDGTTFWTYNDPQEIITKMHYVRDRGLGGAMIWSMDADDTTGTLISAVNQGLSGH